MTLEQRIVAAVKSVRDPEMPVNVYDLGLIYGITVDAEGEVSVRMTLTAPNCPVAERLPSDVASAVRAVEGVNQVRLELVFDPPWSKDRMSADARLALGLDDLAKPAKLLQIG